MPILLAAIHGILTGQTNPSWPDKLDAWMLERDPEIKMLKKEYVAGPFPRWNCWVKDPLLARGLANEIELFLGAVPSPGARTFLSAAASEQSRGANLRPCCHGASCCGQECPRSVWFVAHSNGAVIALLAARRLIARGHRIAGLILTGAACEPDVEKNGILAWRQSGMLGAAIAYCSREDKVLDGDPNSPSPPREERRLVNSPLRLLHSALAWLWGKLMWPYGCLGRTGWLGSGSPLRTPHSGLRNVFTRWFPGGHSAYFWPENMERTFEQIYQDVKDVESKER